MPVFNGRLAENVERFIAIAGEAYLDDIRRTGFYDIDSDYAIALFAYGYLADITKDYANKLDLDDSFS